MTDRAAKLHVMTRALGLAASGHFVGFEHDSLAGELQRIAFKRELRRYAPGLTYELYERAIDRAADHVEKRAAREAHGLRNRASRFRPKVKR